MKATLHIGGILFNVWAAAFCDIQSLMIMTSLELEKMEPSNIKQSSKWVLFTKFKHTRQITL
jgi:hypothetical protein